MSREGQDRVEYVASNQNLGRELLELHTLGKGPKDPAAKKFMVGIDYSQADVEVAAKILAGHNVTDQKYEFIDKNSSMNAYHVNKEGINKALDIKSQHILMAKSFDRAGADRLNDLLLFLANHPATKKNICTKLTKIFLNVASSNVIDRCMQSWGSNGNLKEMYFAIISSPEFWNKNNFKNHIKNPLEMVISQYRASGISLAQFKDLKTGSLLTLKGVETHLIASQVNVVLDSILEYGLPLGKHAEPTGYAQDGSSWLSDRYFACIGRSAFNSANFQDLKDFTWADQYPIYNVIFEKNLSSLLKIDSINSDFKNTFSFYFKNRLGPRFLNHEQQRMLGAYLKDEKLSKRKISGVSLSDLKVNTFMELMVAHTEFLYK